MFLQYSGLSANILSVYGLLCIPAYAMCHDPPRTTRLPFKIDVI